VEVRQYDFKEAHPARAETTTPPHIFGHLTLPGRRIALRAVAPRANRERPATLRSVRHHGLGGRLAAYVRRKRVGAHEYFQVVENRRMEGAPRQRVLVHLGRHESVADALTEWPKEIRRLRARARKDREQLRSLPERERSAAWAKKIARRAETAEKRADALKENLKKLRELKKQDGM
jgi:hypothetical protein